VVKFEDGQLVVLQSNTRFTVREYRYNPKQVKDSKHRVPAVQAACAS